jgi:transcription antitermination protein NusB
MGVRREGRETAVQCLFQHDLNNSDDQPWIDQFWSLRSVSDGVRRFGDYLIKGVLEHQNEIDERIRSYTQHYELKRIAAVDRNILRVALFEMLFCDETPPVVAINEAIEVAKRFGSEESGRFVNGILDRAKADLSRPAREPQIKREGEAPAEPKKEKYIRQDSQDFS